jgi:pyridoxamine 5'-phosphate oxidase
MKTIRRSRPVSISLADLRAEYAQAGLSAAYLDRDPLRQFQRWFEQALKAGLREPNAMVLATVSAAGQPSTRIVLLKGIDERGFTFFTNYQSRKALDLTLNPRAALNFPWIDLERQVNVLGSVSKIDRKESEAYFRSRPRGNRLGAWASRQSEVIADRSVLEKRMAELEAKYTGDDIPMPDYWGGYRLSPVEIEFWQGRPNRLHDRFRYGRNRDGRWKLDRLAP